MNQTHKLRKVISLFAVTHSDATWDFLADASIIEGSLLGEIYVKWFDCCENKFYNTKLQAEKVIRCGLTETMAPNLIY